MSYLTGFLNKLTIYIVLTQVGLSIVMAICTQVWQVQSEFDDSLLAPLAFQESVNSTLRFFTYFLLLSTLLPISLIVCLEVVRLVQASYINNDAYMFSFERNEKAMCQTASIVEDLGQVGYVFSDKTGTLTRNVMEFKYMLVGEEFYGDQRAFE